jgi:hypothetical protein
VMALLAAGLCAPLMAAGLVLLVFVLGWRP